MENEKIKSPFVEQPPEKYDYNKLRDETTVQAIVSIYKVLGENAEKLAYSSTATPDEIGDRIDEVAQKVLEALVAHKVPNCDMQHLIENFQTTIHFIFKSIAKQKNELEKEFMARHIGARDPGNNLYSAEYATLGDFFAALEKIRIEQGNTDYFIVNPKEK